MRIKTYLVQTVSEAMEKIKRDLGPDAVILSTRKAPQNSQWWKMGKPKLEVTAAIDHETKTAEPVTASYLDQAWRYLDKVTEQKIEPLRREIAVLQEALRQGDSKEIEPSLETKSEPLKKLPVFEMVTEEPAHEDEGIIQLSGRLLWHYVEPSLVEDMADYLMKVCPSEGEEIQKQMAAEHVVMALPEPVNPIRAGKIFAFVGPTGVGKTTTLIKLASQILIENKLSVGLISLDHFRIGAHEQLARYAEILKVPFVLCNQKEELAVALETLSDKEVILIDTCGRSPHDIREIELLGSLLSSIQQLSVLLVLPAMLRGDDLEWVLGSYACLNPESLVVTKLDETTHFGILCNAPYISGLPLSFLTMGQNVPEDFELASIDRVVDCLFDFSGQFPVSQESGVSSVNNRENQQGGELQ